MNSNIDTSKMIPIKIGPRIKVVSINDKRCEIFTQVFVDESIMIQYPSKEDMISKYIKCTIKYLIAEGLIKLGPDWKFNVGVMILND